MKRVGYYLVAWGFGGVECYLLTLLRRLDRARWEPVVFFHCTDAADSARMRAELAVLQVPVREVDIDGMFVQWATQGWRPATSDQRPELPGQQPETGQGNQSGSLVRRWLLRLWPRGLKEVRHYRKQARELAELLRRERLDIVHFLHGGYPTLGIPVMASRLAGIPIRLSDVHLDPLDVRRMRWPQRWRAHQAARSITHVRALSRRMGEQLGDMLPELRGRTRIVYNGIDASRFEADGQPDGWRRTWGVPAESRLVATIARLAPVKGHRFLIEAAARLRGRWPDVRYVFVGDGPLRPELEQLVRERGLQDQVMFAGFHNSIPAILRACDVMVLPSLAEGLPLSILEAMAAGVPVIATDVGGNREVLDQETGRLVPPGAVEELADALEELLSLSPAALAAMGEAARRRVRAQYAEQRMVDGVLELYQ